MLSAVFGVVILGNDMKSDQRGSWKVTSRISALVFFDDSLRSGSDCYLLGLGMSLSEISDVEIIFCALFIKAINTFSKKLQSFHVFLFVVVKGEAEKNPFEYNSLFYYPYMHILSQTLVRRLCTHRCNY